jgi:hypothetical protein
MSSRPKDTVELRMRVVRKTEAACLVTGAQFALTPDARSWWVPRSLMGTTRTEKDLKTPTNYDLIIFTLPEWKVDQADLWDYVTS